MESGELVPGSVWFYAPNNAVPAIFAFLFAVIGMWGIWQCSKYKMWYISGVLPWSAALMVVGFTLREVGAVFDDNLGLWISSRVFQYVALIYYTMLNHIILARLLQYIPYHAPIHPGRSLNGRYLLNTVITTLFCSGAPQSMNYEHENPTQIASGRAIMKSALILQLVLIVFTTVVAVWWHWNCSHGRFVRSQGGRKKLFFAAVGRGGGSGMPYSLKRLLYTLYASCALLICCAIFRVVEYFAYSSSFVATSVTATSTDGTIVDPTSVPLVVRYEWFFWIFDAVVILVNTLLWGVVCPVRDLPRDERLYLAEDGVVKQGAGIDDLRWWWMRALDPFDVWGLVKGYPGRWWE